MAARPSSWLRIPIELASKISRNSAESASPAKRSRSSTIRRRAVTVPKTLPASSPASSGTSPYSESAAALSPQSSDPGNFSTPRLPAPPPRDRCSAAPTPPHQQPNETAEAPSRRARLGKYERIFCARLNTSPRLRLARQPLSPLRKPGLVKVLIPVTNRDRDDSQAGTFWRRPVTAVPFASNELPNLFIAVPSSTKTRICLPGATDTARTPRARATRPCDRASFN